MSSEMPFDPPRTLRSERNPFMQVVHTTIPLYVIEHTSGSGMQPQYWTCSSEHGTGWCDRPKQAFSPSELTVEIRRLIDRGWFLPCTIRQLSIRQDREIVDPGQRLTGTESNGIGDVRKSVPVR